MRYGVVQDVSLRAIGGMIDGNVERTLLWQVVGVRCKQIISHGDVHFTLALKLRKRKVAPPQRARRAGIRLAGYSTPNAGTRLPGLHMGLRDRVAYGLQGCSCISNSDPKRAVQISSRVLFWRTQSART